METGANTPPATKAARGKGQAATATAAAKDAGKAPPVRLHTSLPAMVLHREWDTCPQLEPLRKELRGGRQGPVEVALYFSPEDGKRMPYANEDLVRMEDRVAKRFPHRPVHWSIHGYPPSAILSQVPGRQRAPRIMHLETHVLPDDWAALPRELVLVAGSAALWEAFDKLEPAPALELLTLRGFDATHAFRTFVARQTCAVLVTQCVGWPRDAPVPEHVEFACAARRVATPGSTPYMNPVAWGDPQWRTAQPYERYKHQLEQWAVHLDTHFHLAS